jgi:DNA repair exonuclease SbcCD ATPase subunit
MNIQRGKAKGQVMIEVEQELHELRKQEAVWEAELKRDQARADLDAKKMENKTAVAMSLFNEVQERKKERMKTSNDLQESMMRLAAENGALTPEVMQEFLRQQGGQAAPAVPHPCPACQQIVQPEWNVCPHCGTGQQG